MQATGTLGKKKKVMNPIPNNAAKRSGKLEINPLLPISTFLNRQRSDVIKHPYDFTIPLKKQLAIGDSKRIKVIDYFSGKYEKDEATKKKKKRY